MKESFQELFGLSRKICFNLSPDDRYKLHEAIVQFVDMKYILFCDKLFMFKNE